MTIKLTCAQIEVIAGRPDLNFSSILNAIEKAKTDKIDILLLPELAISGYLLGDIWEQPAFLEDCEAYGKKVIAASDGICVLFGNIALDRSKFNEDGRIRKYNAAFVAQNGKLLSGALPYPFVVKNSLPNYREFDDSRYFFSLSKLQQELSKSFEDLVKPVKITVRNHNINLGIMLCEDGWTENYTVKIPDLLAQNGADILCNLSCSPFTLHKNSKRHRLFSEQAKTCGLPLLYCNNVGLQNNGKNVFTYDGCSCAYKNDGVLLTDAQAYEEEFLCVTFEPETKKLYSAASVHEAQDEITEIYMALRYGAQKFLEQMNINKITIGVSGGIDSAVAAAFYVDILGPNNILLVNMPSQYNSPLTKNLALALANALGCNYSVMPIQDSVNNLIEQLTHTTIHNYGSDKNFNLALSPLACENIQARDRTRIIAGLASSFGGAFSCNSNKAELAVGYSTFYGDIAGCLALIGDLWKNQVYALGHYLNENIFKRDVIPNEVFTITPSAELSAAQTVGKGGDPFVYAYHDYLFQAFIEKWNKFAPLDVLRGYHDGTLEEMLGCAPGIIAESFPTPRAFINDLERWWKLFSGFAVAKRIQSPPIMSISRRAFGYDHREAQLSPYFSLEYKSLKQKLLQ